MEPIDAAEMEDAYPLTPTQRGMLFQTLHEESSAYHELVNFDLDGPLDLGALHTAWQCMVAAHPVLRTTYAWRGREEPIQLVHRHTGTPWLELDWTDASPAEQQTRIEEWVRPDRVRYSLMDAPPLRMAIARLEERRHHLFWGFHHILLDGFSTRLLIEELLATYHALREGRAPELEPHTPFRDYVTWLCAQQLGEAEAFWRSELAGFHAPAPLGLGDEAPAAARDFREQALSLPVELSDRIEVFARQHGLAVSTLVHGAWALLLSRYRGEPNVVFGSTTAGRSADLPGIKQMVGLFINTLPIRIRVGTGSTIQWLRELRQQQLTLRRYEYAPLSAVQRWSELPAGQPLFESHLVFQGDLLYPPSFKNPSELQIRHIRIEEDGHYPLTLVASMEPALHLRLVYEASRFGDAAIARALGHLERLFEELITAADRPLSSVQMLTEPERRSLEEWNRSRLDLGDPVPVHRLIEAQVERTPDAVAIAFEGRTLSYRELDRRANQLARHLRSLGVGPEVRVGLFLQRSLELPVALLGDPEGRRRLRAARSGAARRAARVPGGGLRASRVCVTTEALRARCPAMAVCVDSSGALQAGQGEERVPRFAAGIGARVRHRTRPARPAAQGRDGPAPRRSCNHLRWMAARFPLGARRRGPAADAR